MPSHFSSTQTNESFVDDEQMRPLPADDKVRILVASDIHVGYGEKMADRHMDSVDSFEEVLKNAHTHKADFILLGGDLFHENNPSRDMQHRVTRLLRRYCLGDADVAVQFVSDPSVNFDHSVFPHVNYEDANLNVGMPLFTIHGNHDDLAGKGLSALDLLHEAGLLNLFGKFSDIERFVVSPILLRKGATRIALYGISSQRDDRLARAFMEEEIKFLRPQEETESWFNILVLHQNRPRRSTSRSTGACLPEQFIPSFFDLVVWGHEHECKIQPQYVESGNSLGNGFFILQPGSTIATSLRPEEAGRKHCALVTVCGRKFKCEPIPLETPRQVIFEEMLIDELPARFKLPPAGTRVDGMPDEKQIVEKIEEILAQADATRGRRQPKQPLVRLRVTYAGPWLQIPPLNGRRFGASRFGKRVANAADMIQIRHAGKAGNKEKYDARESLRRVEGMRATVEDLVTSHFTTAPLEGKMMVLTEKSLQMALNEYLDGSGAGADRALAEAVDSQVTHLKEALKRVNRDSDAASQLETNGGVSCVDNLESTIRQEILLARGGRLERQQRVKAEPADTSQVMEM